MRFGRSNNLISRGATLRNLTLVCALLLGWMSFAQADESAKKIGEKSASAAEKNPADVPPKTPPQKANGDKPKSDKKNANRAMPGKSTGTDSVNTAVEQISPQREAAAMQFAQQYHPELSVLLQRLQGSHPDQFAKAIRELNQTRERLEKVREQDAERYSIMLREWILDSRVRLLAARLTMSTSAELETELRQVLTERHDVRLQLLTYDRERSKSRLQKMDEQIAEHVQNRESAVDRELDRIKKSADVRKKNLKPAAKRPVQAETEKKSKGGTP